MLPVPVPSLLAERDRRIAKRYARIERTHATLLSQLGEKFKLRMRREPPLHLSHFRAKFWIARRRGDSLFDGFARRIDDRDDSALYRLPFS
jgi:hypothetical protein